MKARSPARLFSVSAALIVFAVVARLVGQSGGVSLTILAKEGRRTIPLTMVGGQEYVALDDLASLFQLTVREESGAITVSYKTRTIVLTPDQPLASVAGRVTSLAGAPARAGSRWTVPVDFISRALAPIYDGRLDLRRPSHLLIVGDLRVPRVSMRYEPLANAARLTIDATPRAAPMVTQDADRLIVKFDADAIDTVIPALQPQAFVQAVRTLDAVTLGIDLGPRFAAARSSTEDIENTTRLVIDLVGADAPAVSSSASPTPPPPPPADLLLNRPQAVIRTIAVDAGHGGDDEGARGAEGTLEKNLTLAVARRLKNAVEGRLGIRVLLTRDEDRAVPIDERSAIANNSKADLFISLHANAAMRAGPNGASVHVAAFADVEGARASLAPERVPAFGGTLRDIELVPWNLAQIRYLEQSTVIAGIIEQALTGRVKLDGRSPVPAPYRVLESANMPAVLIEMGYLTNPDQEKAMAGAEFQNALVQAIIDGIVTFREYLQQNPEDGR